MTMVHIATHVQFLQYNASNFHQHMEWMMDEFEISFMV
jgi:hypothetical protein